MSCSSFDWKAYALGELDAKERRTAEAHAATCSGCRKDLAEARLTLDALSTLREEEVPRRIAFVSDKVFEPKWWQAFLKPSFAAGALIAGAILVHAFLRPAANDAAIQARIDQAIEQIDARQAAQMESVVRSTLEMIDKQNKVNYIRNAGLVRE